MGGDHEREPADARPPKQPPDASLGRAAVEEDGRAVGMLDQGGVPLPDVEKANGELTGRSGRPEPRRGGEPDREQRNRESSRADGARRPPPGGGTLGKSRSVRCRSFPAVAPQVRCPDDRDADAGIGRTDLHRGGEREREAAAGHVGAALGHATQVRQRQPRERAERLREHLGRRQDGAREAERALHHAEPHGGRNRGQREQVREEPGERDRSEVKRHQRRCGERGRDRDRGALGNPAHDGP